MSRYGKRLGDDSNIIVEFNKKYDVKITKNSAALRCDKKVVKSVDLNDIPIFVFMTLKEGLMVFNIDSNEYRFDNIEYDYSKISNILIKQNKFANNFKNLYIREIENDINDAVENVGYEANDVQIKYEKSVAVLFIVSEFRDNEFNQFHDNVQSLINTLSELGFEIYVLMGKEATLQSFLEELAEKIKPKDKVTRLLFYYFGHMMKKTDDFSAEYQLTCYTKNDDESDKLLSVEQLLRTIKSLKFQHNCVLIDSCESARIITKPTEKFVSRNAPDPSFYLITASVDEIYAKALLADCFVKSLGDGTASLDVICGKMIKYAENEINKLINGKNLNDKTNHALLIRPVISKDKGYGEGKLLF